MDISVTQKSKIWSLIPRAMAEEWTIPQLAEAAGVGYDAARNALREVHGIIQDRVKRGVVRVAGDASSVLAEMAALDIEDLNQLNDQRKKTKGIADEEMDKAVSRKLARIEKCVRMFGVQLDPRLIDSGNNPNSVHPIGQGNIEPPPDELFGLKDTKKEDS